MPSDMVRVNDVLLFLTNLSEINSSAYEDRGMDAIAGRWLTIINQLLKLSFNA